jgi:hypothetical protein
MTGGAGIGWYSVASSNTDAAVVNNYISGYGRCEIYLVGEGRTEIRAMKNAFDGYGESEWSEPVTLTVEPLPQTSADTPARTADSGGYYPTVGATAAPSPLPSSTVSPATPRPSERTSLRPDAYLEPDENGNVRPEDWLTRYEAVEIFYKLADADKSAVGAPPYRDVPLSDPRGAAVGFLSRMGALSGYPDGTFRGESPMTRAEFIAIASHFFPILEGGAAPYSDVAPDHWAYGFIVSARNHLWISGYPDGAFRPDNPITRAEAAAIINSMLFAGLFDYTGQPPFADVGKDKWYYNDLVIAVLGGVLETE